MIDLGILITGGIGLITTIVSGWTSWFFARKKYNSEVDSTVINNMQQSLEFYKKLSDDNRVRLEAVLEQNKRLETRNDVLEGEIRELKNKMFSFMSSVCLDLSCSIRQGNYNLGNINLNKENKDEK